MSKRLTNTEFINKSKTIHNDKYDYSLVNYVNSTTKVKIICPEHGEFEQVAYYHNQGSGCPKCCSNYKMTQEKFIEKSKKIHNNKYDYSRVKYINSTNKVKIICNKHGEFEQIAHDHINGFGCSKCSNNHNYSTSEFISKAKKIHNNKYDYSRVKYINARTKIEIICSKHGVFSQQPYLHLYGNGCLICKESKGEKKIMHFLEKNKIEYIREKTFDKCKGKTRLLPFDFYLPKQNLLIEYDGRQHFEPVEFFGISNERAKNLFILTQKNDRIKNNFAKKNKIKLLRISYRNYNNLNKILDKQLI